MIYSQPQGPPCSKLFLRRSIKNKKNPGYCRRTVLAHCDEFKKEAFSHVICTPESNRSLNILPPFSNRLQRLLAERRSLGRSFSASQSHAVTSRKSKKKKIIK